MSIWNQIINYVPTPTPKTKYTQVKCILDKYYWIEKKNFPLKDTEKLQKALTIQPIAFKKFVKENPPPLPCYLDKPEWLGVPRFWGLEHLGEPTQTKLTEGSPMHSDLKFMGQLKDTPSKPQITALNKWLSNNSTGVISLPTGAGKTVLALAAAMEKRRCTLILVHNADLLTQWRERIQTFVPGARIGLFQQQTIDIEDKDFILGMLPTLTRRTHEQVKPLAQKVGLLIIDEAHHLPAETFSKVSGKFYPLYTLGLSATPKRSDAKTDLLYWLIGPLIFTSQIKYDLPFSVKKIEYHLEIVPEFKHKWEPDCFLSRVVVADAYKNRLVVQETKKLFNQGVQKCMVISARINHLEKYLLPMFKTHLPHIPCIILKGGKKRKKDAEPELINGPQVILSSFKFVVEGLDINGLNGMIIASPIQGNLIQLVGRMREQFDQHGQPIPRYLVDMVDMSVEDWKIQGLNRCRKYKNEYQAPISIEKISENCEPINQKCKKCKQDLGHNWRQLHCGCHYHTVCLTGNYWFKECFCGEKF